MPVQIIAQVGDTHSLKVQDMGKRRFLRLGASEKNPGLVQGTLHTGPVFGAEGGDTATALALLGLTLFDPEKNADYGGECFAYYFITGAVAYSVSITHTVAEAVNKLQTEIAKLESEPHLPEETQKLLDHWRGLVAAPETLGSDFTEVRFGILASIREIPSEDNFDLDDDSETGDPEFDRQYFGAHASGQEAWYDSSVAKELDAAIAEYARQKEAA